MTLNSNTLDNMKLEEYLPTIEQFLKDYLKVAHADGYVLGLSGGVDSSLVAAIAKKAVGKENLTCILMPVHSNPKDLEDGIKVAESLDVNYVVLDGSKAFDTLKEEFVSKGQELSDGSSYNLKVRIRMCMLYAYGQTHNYLVLGTDNADERYTGYFTKHGDGACDILPIVHLIKSEVVQAAKIYGIPNELAERTPTAGLFPGQTDEKEMGITYKELDDFLLGKEINPTSKARIEHLHKVSEHKRKEVPAPKEFIRD